MNYFSYFTEIEDTFVRRRGKFKELAPGDDGLFRSETFPGLWLDPAALLGRDRKRLLAQIKDELDPLLGRSTAIAGKTC